MVKILTSKKAKSSSHWIEGYQENEWNEFLQLENASFLENDKEFYFTTTTGNKIGYTKDYLDKRDDEIISYTAPGSMEIIKYLSEPGIFEIITRTGHCFKVQVTSDYNQPKIKISYYKVILSPKEMRLISSGFEQRFLPRYDSNETFYERDSLGNFNLFFRYLTVISNQLNYYQKNGTLARGDNYPDWIKITANFNNAQKIEDIPVYEISKLQKYNHQNF